MDKHELANRSLMNEDDAELILSRIEGSALWTPEMIVELSLNGFRPAEIHHRMQYDPMFLIAYLAIRESEFIDEIDFHAIANTGVTMQDAANALITLNSAMDSLLNPPSVITAPDGIPISDTEYYEAFHYEAYSMDLDKPILPSRFEDV